MRTVFRMLHLRVRSDMELNDTVEVTLTQEGANIINKGNNASLSYFPSLELRTDYKEGDKYKAELHDLFYKFGVHCCPGADVLFTNLIPEEK